MRWLLSVFSFQGRIGRIGYALAVAAIFVAQYLFAAVCATALGRAVSLDVWFWLFPLRTLVSLSTAPASLLAVAMVATLVADALLAALSFRRAADGHVTIPIAILAVMPVVQFIAI